MTLRTVFLITLSLFLIAHSANGQQKLVGPLSISVPSVTAVPLTIRAVAGQTAHLQEWRDSLGTVKSYVDYDGSFHAVMSAAGLTAGNLVYADANGNFKSAPVFLDVATANLTFMANDVIITSAMSVDGLLRANAAEDFGPSASAVVSTAGRAKLRVNAGVLQVSNNGAAYATLTTQGSSPTFGAITATSLGVGTINATGITTTGLTIGASPVGTHTCVTSVDFAMMTTTTATCLGF